MFATGGVSDYIATIGPNWEGNGYLTIPQLKSALDISSNGCRLQTGSYTGNGTYGVNNPCTLTFDFIPKLILILPTPKGNGYFYFHTLTNSITNSGSSRSIGMNCVASLNGTTFSWYTTAASDDVPTMQQGNYNGYVYVWYAIG